MNDNALSRRLKALIIFRVSFVTLLLGTFLLFEIEYYKFPYTHAMRSIIIFLYLLTIVYALLLHRIKNLTAFAYVQLSIDALSAITLVFLTGGIESWFSPIMLLTVIASAIMVNRRAGYIIATLCSILYGLMIDLQFYRVIPVAYDISLEEKDFLYNIFVHITALYLTAYLTGYISSRLEKTSKKLEERDSDLKDLDFFNRELIESLPSGLLTTDLQGRILIFNRAAENITGIPRTVAAGKDITEIFPFIKFSFETQRREGIITPNGNKRTIGLTISRTTDSSGYKTGCICTFQDITDFKKIAAELKQKETLAVIGELSANMAHEIRNPLASLKVSIEMLKEGVLTKDHGAKLMNIALSEMDRLNKIITDFLTYSRPKDPEFFMFDLNTMLDETIEIIKNSIANRDSISIKKDFKGQNEIIADPQKLRQVFLNLGINAIESMPDGGELVIGVKRLKDQAVIFFKDSGTGIPPENLKQIFYPFFTTKEKGTGLGLSIAYRIVEKHNGKITVHSLPGHGTTFEVALPLTPSPSSLEDRTSKEDQAKVGKP